MNKRPPDWNPVEMSYESHLSKYQQAWKRYHKRQDNCRHVFVEVETNVPKEELELYAEGISNLKLYKCVHCDISTIGL